MLWIFHYVQVLSSPLPVGRDSRALAEGDGKASLSGTRLVDPILVRLQISALALRRYARFD
jgi:hypothetical protein